MNDATTFIYQIKVTIKDDGLTQDAQRSELASMLEHALSYGVRGLPWVVGCDAIEIKPERWTSLPPAKP